MLKTKMLTELNAALSSCVHSVSEATDKQLDEALQIVERAYIHIVIEQGLRSRDTGVSRLTVVTEQQ
jgi:hypothetical protein